MECCSVPPLSSAPASPPPLPPRPRLALLLSPLCSCPPLSLSSFLSVSLPQVWRLLWLALLAERWLTVWLSFWLPWCLSAPLAAPGLPPQAPCWGSCHTRGVKAQAPAPGGHAAPGTPPDPPVREPPRTTRRTRKPSDPSEPTFYPPTSNCAPEPFTPPLLQEWCSVLVCKVHSWGRRVETWLWHSLDVCSVCIFCSSRGEHVQKLQAGGPAALLLSALFQKQRAERARRPGLTPAAEYAAPWSWRRRTRSGPVRFGSACLC